MKIKWGSLWKPRSGHTTWNVTMDIWPRARTYGQSMIGELHFYQSSHKSCFPCSRVVLIEVGLIEGFHKFGESGLVRLLRDATRPRWVLTHIMLNVIFYALHYYFVYQENMHICNSYNLCLLHKNSIILRKRCVECVNKVRLVNEHPYKIQTR